MYNYFAGGLFPGHQSIWALAIIWALVWKAWSLWIAARKNQKIWFGALLLINTMGILEILYVFIFSKKNCCGGAGCKKTFSAEEAKKIGEKLGINWSKYDVEQFRMGLEVELEHGCRDASTNVTNDDPELTGKIAMAHLNEFADYYTRLDKMEKEADVFWGKKD